MTEEINRQEGLENRELESFMHRYQQSDAAATALLAERLSPKLYRFFFAQTQHRDQAEDLLQDCWLRIHKARHTYRPGEPLLPWIYAIARHVQVDQYRKARRIARIELPAEHTDVTVSAAQEPASPPGPDLWELLKTLPPQQRDTVLLLKVAGLSLQEVSRSTGASIGAVKQRAHRAYTTLRRLFGEKR